MTEMFAKSKNRYKQTEIDEFSNVYALPSYHREILRSRCHDLPDVTVIS